MNNTYRVTFYAILLTYTLFDAVMVPLISRQLYCAMWGSICTPHLSPCIMHSICRCFVPKEPLIVSDYLITLSNAGITRKLSMSKLQCAVYRGSWISPTRKPTSQQPYTTALALVLYCSSHTLWHNCSQLSSSAIVDTHAYFDQVVCILVVGIQQ